MDFLPGSRADVCHLIDRYAALRGELRAVELFDFELDYLSTSGYTPMERAA